MWHDEQIAVEDVIDVYRGPERRLWELLMGEHLHVGGWASSMALAERARIAPGSWGIDLCCCTGAGMRFLIRELGVRRMTGVDFTAAVIELGRERTRDAGLGYRIDFVFADACATGLGSMVFDFVWGEDAWCYVADKPALIAEAARLARPGGTIAFTDWVEGPAGLAPDDARRLLRFMKFPSIESVDGYRMLLEGAGCRVEVAEPTTRFAECAPLYLAMLRGQLKGDVLRLIGHDAESCAALERELEFIVDLARTGALVQGMFIATRSPA